MNSVQADYVVIGGGMSGSMAALELSRLGKDVILLRHGPGSLGFNSGTLDNGSQPGLDHPLQSSMEHYQLPLQGGFDQPMLLCSATGTLRPAYYAMHSIAQGDLSQLKHDDKIAVIFIKGLESIPADKFIDNLKADLTAHNITCQSISHHHLTLPDIENKHLHTARLAKLLDQEQQQLVFLEHIQKLYDQHKFTHLLFPPALGLRQHHNLYQTLQQKFSIRCAEYLAVPPSVPGLRMRQHLDALLSQYDIRVMHNPARTYQQQDRSIQSLDVYTDRKVTIQAKGFLLATGGLQSGGIHHTETLQEALFDLPLFLDKKRIDGRLIDNLLQNDFLAEHPLLKCGVRVNRNYQPLDEAGEPIFNNLTACGSLLTATARHGMGNSLTSGILAAKAMVSR